MATRLKEKTKTPTEDAVLSIAEMLSEGDYYGGMYKLVWWKLRYPDDPALNELVEPLNQDIDEGGQSQAHTAYLAATLQLARPDKVWVITEGFPGGIEVPTNMYDAHMGANWRVCGLRICPRVFAIKLPVNEDYSGLDPDKAKEFKAHSLNRYGMALKHAHAKYCSDDCRSRAAGEKDKKAERNAKKKKATTKGSVGVKVKRVTAKRNIKPGVNAKGDAEPAAKAEVRTKAKVKPTVTDTKAKVNKA